MKRKAKRKTKHGKTHRLCIAIIRALMDELHKARQVQFRRDVDAGLYDYARGM